MQRNVTMPVSVSLESRLYWPSRCVVLLTLPELTLVFASVSALLTVHCTIFKFTCVYSLHHNGNYCTYHLWMSFTVTDDFLFHLKPFVNFFTYVLIKICYRSVDGNVLTSLNTACPIFFRFRACKGNMCYKLRVLEARQLVACSLWRPPARWRALASPVAIGRRVCRRARRRAAPCRRNISSVKSLARPLRRAPLSSAPVAVRQLKRAHR